LSLFYRFCIFSWTAEAVLSF